MEITEVILTINGQPKSYAALCPANLSTTKFLEGLVRQILFTPASLRLAQVPGLSEQIDKADVTNIDITVTR